MGGVSQKPIEAYIHWVVKSFPSYILSDPRFRRESMEMWEKIQTEDKVEDKVEDKPEDKAKDKGDGGETKQEKR